jgi:signal transduction histidine kinase
VIDRLFAPFARPETYRALLFYVAGVALGSLGLAVLIAGWCVTLCFAITPLVFPLLIALRSAVGLLAQAEAGLARRLLGTPTSPPLQTTGASFWSRALNVLTDMAFWRQQAYVLAAWSIALVQVTVLSVALELATVPLYYRWFDGFQLYGVLDIGSLPQALLVSSAGLVVLALAVHLVGPLAAVSRRLAARLLGDDATRVARPPAEVTAIRRRAFAISATVAAGVSAVLIVVWALTTRAYFWPAWPMLALGLVLAIFGWVLLVLERPSIARRLHGSATLAGHAGISSAICIFLVGVWALAGGGYFWPVWSLFGFGLGVIVHASVVYVQREIDKRRRIEELETTRAGAVNVQESELRRIERDLHDGAQARLVALGMSLGMAEEKLRNDPEAARTWLAEARIDAREALEELRDLARGIHPPILTDRGLEAAIAALAARGTLPVTLSVNVPERPMPAVETAAYFVVAEALANATKHANAERIDIKIWRSNATLVAEVVDDGDGGANPSGNGLTGLKQRVGALDGTLRIESPVGGPTTVRAELPCE